MAPDGLDHSKEYLLQLSDGELQAEWIKYMAYSRARQNLREAVQRMLRKKSSQQQIKLNEIAVGAMATTKLGDREILLANVEGRIYAMDNACGHSGYPLSQGQLDGCIVTCLWHGAKFDVRSGEVIAQGNDLSPAKRFQVKISAEGLLAVGEEL